MSAEKFSKRLLNTKKNEEFKKVKNVEKETNLCREMIKHKNAIPRSAPAESCSRLKMLVEFGN